MGRGSGGTRVGMPVGDGTYKGEIKNVEDLVAIKNRQLYKKVGEAISRYHSVLGVRERNVKLAELSGRTNGVHATGSDGTSQGIFLNSKLYKNGTVESITQRARDAYKSGWSTDTNKPVAHTVTHELAHATWNNKLSSKNAQAATKDIRSLYLSWRKDKNKKGYGEYAKTNINEFWAEVTTKAVHGTPDKYTRAVKDIVKKYKL